MVNNIASNDPNPLRGADCLFEECARFIYALAIAVERYAGHSHDTDLFLHRVIRSLGLQGDIHATPNSMIIALWHDEEIHQTVFTVAARDTNYDMTRLSEIMAIAGQLESGRISPAEGVLRLRRVADAPNTYSTCYNAFVYFLSGVAFGVLLGVSWMEVFFGGVLGLVTYGFEGFVRRIPGSGHMLEFLVTANAAFLAGVIAVLLPGTHAIALTICAVVIYLPGFGLTIAPREILLGDTLSGIIYFTKAFFVAIKMLFGFFIGFSCANYLLTVPAVEPVVGVPHLFTWLFVPLLPLCVGIFFNVSPHRLWLVVAGALLVWTGVEWGSLWGPWQGAFFGALVLAIYARLSTLQFNIPLSTTLLPCIMILVPGMGFINFLYALQTKGIIAGTELGLQVFITIAAIIGGGFLGDFAASALTDRKKEGFSHLY
jgi:uncharacterized membrane protein YjjP (DUF1212 family)